MTVHSESSTECIDQVAKNEDRPAIRKPFEALADMYQQPRLWLRCGMLLTVLLYIRTTAFDFVWDDLGIPAIPRLKSWKMLWDIFTHGLFNTAEGAHSVYYRPLSVLWTVAIKQFTSGTPAWYHLFTLATNLCVFYLAYALGRRLLHDDRVAALTAVLFALHPGKVESVAWIGSGGCDGLGAIFFFAIVIFYLKWREQQRGRWLALSVLFFAAAMLTKETLVVAVALLPLHYWLTATQDKRHAVQAVGLTAPYLLVLAAYMVVRRMVLTAPATTVNVIQPKMTFEGLWDAPYACWWYARHLVFPVRLGAVYDFNAAATVTTGLLVAAAGTGYCNDGCVRRYMAWLGKLKTPVRVVCVDTCAVRGVFAHGASA